MLEKIIHFIKYNNATVIILAVILILGGGVLAAGPEAIGQKQTTVQGVDNAALLAADFSAFNMDFKIENLEQDEQYYYVTYSFLDLTLAGSAWQYQLSQRTRKVSKKIKEDIGLYMAKFLVKHYQARTRELKREQNLAQSQGRQKRLEVTEYSGLIGRTLDLAAKVFPGYEPIVKRELPAPAFADALAGRPDFNLPVLPDNLISAQPATGVDNLTRIYNEYVAEHPEIFNPPAEAATEDEPFKPEDPAEATEPPAETDESTVEPEPDPTETLDIPEPDSVDIIELPEPAPESEPAPEPTPEPEPAPELTPAPAE